MQDDLYNGRKNGVCCCCCSCDHTCYVLDEVSSLYKLAAVEHAALRTRNWANLLDSSDLEILEFASDLKV